MHAGHTGLGITITCILRQPRIHGNQSLHPSLLQLIRRMVRHLKPRPLLIDGGKFRNTYVEELFNGPSGIGPDSNQPRTAVGVTDDNKMVVFVSEGREMTDGVNGLTTEDVANVLLDLGCKEAINLDGGGSSCMLVCGKNTIKVSDGSQRAVASTIMIK